MIKRQNISKNKIIIIAISTIILVCIGFKNVFGLTMLEERFKVILANSSGSWTKQLYVDLSDGVYVTENPGVRYYSVNDEVGTVYNSIAPAAGTVNRIRDTNGVLKDWKSLGGSVSGGWANYSKSAVNLNSVDATSTTPFVRLPKVEKNGHTFTGWTITQTQTPYYYFNGALRSTSGSSKITTSRGWYQLNVGMNSNALTVKPNFTKNTYYVYYNANGGIGAPSTQSFIYDSGAKISSTTPTRAGYTFAGWDYNGTHFNAGQAIPTGWGTFTLTAKWTIVNYSISYNLVGGNITNPPTSYTVANAVAIPNPTRVGYEFVGWNGSNGATPQKNISIPLGSVGNKSYTANWIPLKPTITTKYDRYYLEQEKFTKESLLKGMKAVDGYNQDISDRIQINNFENVKVGVKGDYTITISVETEYGGIDSVPVTIHISNKLYQEQVRAINASTISTLPNASKWSKKIELLKVLLQSEEIKDSFEIKN